MRKSIDKSKPRPSFLKRSIDNIDPTPHFETIIGQLCIETHILNRSFDICRFDCKYICFSGKKNRNKLHAAQRYISLVRGCGKDNLFLCQKSLSCEQREKKQIPHTMPGIVFLKLVRLVTAGYLIYVAGRGFPLTTILHIILQGLCQFDN